jgi:hypothetical protein
MSVPTADIQTFLSSLQNVIGEFAKTLKEEPKRKKIVKKASKAKAEKADKEEPKKRGRPAKAKAEKAEKEEPKKRGRPAKAEKAETSVPKRRGRPPKTKTKVENEVDVVDVAKALVDMSEKTVAKKRGRPTKPENVGKPKPQRKAPQASAKDFEIGDSMTGLDGFVWIVAQRAKTGGHYWKKAYLIEDK